MARLPYAHVDNSLRALAGQAEGFGRSAIGGLHGSIYHVTSLAESGLKAQTLGCHQRPDAHVHAFHVLDDGNGSLRAGCRIQEPLWIVFEVSGTIHLNSYLNVSSYKTIDGRGQRIKLMGNGLRLKECEHVIVCNLEFEGGRGHDVDGIQIRTKSRHIWIDRCSLCGYDDGLIDITRESTDITVSRCHFAQHDKTMLIGADPTHTGDRCMRVTIHHCFFDGTMQRHPRVRFAKVLLYNNYTRNWGIYAVCASVESQILSQCNIYEAGKKKEVFRYTTEKAADCEEAASGWVRSEGDLFLNGSQPCLVTGPGVDSVFKASECCSTLTMEAPSVGLKEVLQICTGWQAIPRPPEIASTA
ncbi:probable pectate lyase 4 isoform X1 [Magnolia sinica]|uniref:probable pectate lyase 4 isoform X1 n=1 Tax=Magnolia sinica TaxID=86752 RepID=UPI00265A0188|nr:probable pectate lyase 4 isoform X1 [Magnolia sinica]